MIAARALGIYFHSRRENMRGKRPNPDCGRVASVRRQASGLTTYPLSLGVVNFEIIAEEIFHCDLLLLRQTVIFR